MDCSKPSACSGDLNSGVMVRTCLFQLLCAGERNNILCYPYNTSKLQNLTTQVDVVRGLSVLEAYMLVAVVRLQRRGGAGGASFERAFAEYEGLQRLHRTADAYGRAAALKAFERLLSAALLDRPGGRWVSYDFWLAELA